MSAIQKQVEAASEEYSSSFTKGDLALPPAKKYLVLTCMDARIDPARAFGIELGDAHVIRNVCLVANDICVMTHIGRCTDMGSSLQAGAIAEDALRSIVISEQLLGACASPPFLPTSVATGSIVGHVKAGPYSRALGDNRTCRASCDVEQGKTRMY
jgi:hypothetical protein